MRGAAILLIVVAGCTSPDSGEEEIPLLDYEFFATTVQPILGAKCGNPSCHGRAERAFSIFSQRNWRNDERELFLSTPLSEEEMEHNFISSSLQVDARYIASESFLLLKPLGDLADTYHGGGIIFSDETDRSYRTLLNWIENGSNAQ